MENYELTYYVCIARTTIRYGRGSGHTLKVRQLMTHRQCVRWMWYNVTHRYTL